MACFLHILVDEIGDTMHQGMSQSGADILLAPRHVDFLRPRAPLEALGDLQHALGGIRTAIEQHILNPLAQFGWNILVDRQLAGIDDAHIHAVLHPVIQEDGMHGFADLLIAAEGEGHVRDATRDMAMRQVLADAAGTLEEFDSVVVVFLDTGSDRENVGVEDDIFRREADLLSQQLIGARANLVFAIRRIGLPLFIECHDHHGSAVTQDLARLGKEGFFALLHADRVDDGLALHAFQAGLDHLPFRAVDHDRHARNIGLGGDQVEVFHHRRLGIEHALVHVDVDDLRAVFNLLAGHRQRGIEIVIQDQLAEFRRTRDVGALADVDKHRAVETTLFGFGRESFVNIGHAAGTAKGSRPLRRSCGGMVGMRRGLTPFTLSAIARI